MKKSFKLFLCVFILSLSVTVSAQNVNDVLSFSQDSSTLYVTSLDEHFFVIDINKFDIEHAYKLPVEDLKVEDVYDSYLENEVFIVTDKFPYVRVYSFNLESKELSLVLSDTARIIEMYNLGSSVNFSPDRTKVAYATSRDLNVYDIKTDELTVLKNITPKNGHKPANLFWDHYGVLKASQPGKWGHINIAEYNFDYSLRDSIVVRYNMHWGQAHNLVMYRSNGRGEHYVFANSNDDFTINNFRYGIGKPQMVFSYVLNYSQVFPLGFDEQNNVVLAGSFSDYIQKIYPWGHYQEKIYLQPTEKTKDLYQEYKTEDFRFIDGYPGGFIATIYRADGILLVKISKEGEILDSIHLDSEKSKAKEISFTY